MTILTKPSSEKKQEKIPLPLSVDSDGLPMPTAPVLIPSINGDADNESMVFRQRHMSPSTTIFLFLSAISVMLMGILGGVTIYRLYAPSFNRMHYRGACDIPYIAKNGTLARFYQHPDFIQLTDLKNLFPQIFGNDTDFKDVRASNLINDDMLTGDFFREEFEMDLTDDQSYFKIEVPDFKDGRRGRFMHDFKQNQSAIIDTNANRCFIMPLDRDTTMPPRNFFDLLQKMNNGYYDINTDRVRKNMRVITPEITDTSMLSPRIAQECIGMKVYLLEKYQSGVFKRAAIPDLDAGKFAEFTGRGIIEINLMNIHDIENYEKKQQN